MNLKRRANVVRAMDTMVRSVNNEELIFNWLALGVADGDITGKETDEDLEYYCDDENFEELMRLFLEIMNDAYDDSGLYVDGVVSK